MMRPGRVLLPTDTGLEEGKNKNTAKLLVVRVLDAAKKQELFEYGRAQRQKKMSNERNPYAVAVMMFIDASQYKGMPPATAVA